MKKNLKLSASLVGYLMTLAVSSNAQNVSFPTTSANNGASGTGGYNFAFFGANAGISSIKGSSGNSFFGSSSGKLNTTGSENTAMGTYAFEHNVAGSYNVAIGNSALRYLSNINDNTAVGYEAGIGYMGDKNTAVGRRALGTFGVRGYENTAIGYYAQVADSFPSDKILTNATAIGARAIVSQSNSLVLGSIKGFNHATENTNVGIGTATPQYSLDVNGEVSAINVMPISDQRYKTNAKPLDGPAALNKILNLTGLTYDWNKKDFPNMNFNDGRQIGFFAQEVEKVIPEAVSKNGKGFYNLNYNMVIPVLTEAVKEQQNMIQQQQQQIDELKRMILTLTQQISNKNVDASTQDIKITPNPNNGKFTISPSKGIIEVFDQSGKRVKTLQSNNIIQKIDLSGSPNGTYIVKVTDGSKSTTRQIIINK